MIQIAEGVFQIDTGFIRPECTAVYLIRRGDRWGLFDTGVGSTTDRILTELQTAKVILSAIFVSHVHLDHSGGAGQLAQVFPDATVYAHPRGAPHLIDPSRLEASSRAVYGDAIFDELYGSPVPVNPSQVQPVADSEEVWGMRCLDSPGHARHHFALWDEETRTLFAGDSCGLGYPGSPRVGMPSTSPTQFDPEEMLRTIARVQGLSPERLCLAHFGSVESVAKHLEQVKKWTAEFSDTAMSLAPEPDRISLIEKALRELVGAQTAETYDMDLRLNAAGLDAWLSRTLPTARSE